MKPLPHDVETGNDGTDLMMLFTRDLCVCTLEELEYRWKGVQLDAINILLKQDGKSFDSMAENHNPIYFLTTEVFLDDVRDEPEFLHASYHRDIICANTVEYALNDSKDRGMLMLGPRESLKTTFQHGGAPLWFMLRNYWLLDKFVSQALIHHKDEMAWKNLDRIRLRMAHHAWFKKIWAECSAPPNTLGSKKAIRLPCAPKGEGGAEAHIEAGGMGGSLTGSHYAAIWFSDLVTEDHKNSPTLREDTLEKHTSMKYLLDRVGGRRLYDGTMYHPHDLWNTFLSSKDKKGKCIYRTVVVGAGYEEARELIEAGSAPDSPEVISVLTLPGKWTWENMEADREEFILNVGHDDFFWAQIENKIHTERTIATNIDWLKYVEEDQIHPGGISCVFVDPAWKGTAEQGIGDYASIQVWTYERRGPIVTKTLRDGIRSNTMSPKDGMDTIFTLGRKYGCIFCAPEQTGVSGIRAMIEDECIIRGYFMQVIKLKDTFANYRKVNKAAGGKKGARIMQFIAEAQAGRIYISEDCDPGVRLALESQFENYAPGALKYDDDIDCASMTGDSAVKETVIPVNDSSGSNVPFWARGPKTEPVDQRRTRYCNL